MKYPIRVYYEDTDAGGVVYHASYLCYFERARTELLRSLGFSQQALLADSIAFVVKKLTIDYKIAAKLDDSLEVKTTLVELKRATLVFFQQLVNKQNKILCEALVTVASVDLEKMKPIAVPVPIREAFLKINNNDCITD